MSYCKVIAGLLLALPATALADGFVLGGGIDGDSADGRALAAFADVGLGERTWLSGLAGIAETDGILTDNRTRHFDAGLDHSFGPLGIRAGGGYWGNPDLLDSRDLRAAVYVSGEAGSLALNYEKRRFEFDLQSDALRGRTARFSADGWGLTSRLSLGDRAEFRLSGMRYDYSRNIRLQPDIDLLAYLARSRLSMLNSLIDDRLEGALEFRFGLKSLDLTAGRWRTAVDGATVTSIGLGYLAPLSDRMDIELRLALDDSEVFGSTTSLSLYLYYFGGSADSL